MMFDAFIDFNIRGLMLLAIIIGIYRHLWTKYAASNPTGAAAAKGVASKLATQFLTKLLK